MAHPDYVARLQDGASSGRPPVAARRLRVVDAEPLVFQLKTPWANGTTSLVLSPTELLEKLAALVPPPRLNLVRYHGVLAPACPDRAQIVPGPSPLTQPDDAQSGRRSSGFMGQVAGQSVSVRCDVSQLLGSHEDLDGAYRACPQALKLCSIRL